MAITLASLFLKKQVKYLQRAKDARRTIIIFIVGSCGTSLLILGREGASLTSGTKLFGDFLAFLAMLSDVIATIALILYVKNKNAFTGIDYTIRKISILAVFLSPVAITFFSSSV